VGVRVGVAYSRSKLSLCTRLRNLNLKSKLSNFDSFRDIDDHIYDFFKLVDGLWALKWAWQTLLFFVGISHADSVGSCAVQVCFSLKSVWPHIVKDIISV